MKRVLVTEISSRQDQQLVAYLLSQNFIVRILSESIDAGNPLLRFPIEIYPGNLSDAATVARSARGCDYIIQTQPPSEGKISLKDCINRLHETMNIMEAAFVAGVKTMLHISQVSLINNANSQFENGKDQLRTVEMDADPSMPMVQRMLAKTRTSGIKIILVQALLSPNEHAVGGFDNYAVQVVKILTNGRHANSYVIGELKPCGTIHWIERLQDYWQIAQNKKMQLAKYCNMSRRAFNISKLFGSIIILQDTI